MIKFENALLTNILILLMVGCQYAKVSTDHMSADVNGDELKGRKLLEESVVAMGYDKFDTIQSYKADALFDWHFPWGIMPMNPLPGAKGNKVRFRFLPDSFDGQVEHLEGRKSGDIYGLQSWTFYELEGEKYQMSKSPRREWGLATYHYLLEGPFRLLKADIIQYAGQADYNGITYDLVFATWSKREPHKEHDQWLFYINPDTKMVDLVNATIREYFLPFPKNMAEGTVLYKRKRHESGIFFPEEMTIC